MKGILTIEDAKFMFRPNFEGRGDKYNPEGRRYFNVQIDSETAAALDADGWNVKKWESKEDPDAEPIYYIKVRVNYASRNQPKIYTICNGVLTLLDEETVGSLDYDEIETMDLTINPSEWEMNGTTGISAYLKTMYVTLVCDPLAAKYQ